MISKRLSAFDDSNLVLLNQVLDEIRQALGTTLYVETNPTTATVGSTIIQDNGTTQSVSVVTGKGTLVSLVPSAVLAGASVQVVNTQTGAVATGTTTMPNDDSIPQKTEGDEYMTLAITPTSATNILKIDVVFFGNEDSNVSNVATVALFQDDTVGALAAGQFGLTQNQSQAYGVSFTYWMTAGTTSATTFKVRAGMNSGGTFRMNGGYGSRQLGGVLMSSITITEIKV